MSKQQATTTYGHMYYEDKKYRLLTVPINEEIKEIYVNFAKEHDLGHYGIQSTSAPWRDRDYNFQIKEGKLYFHSLVLKSSMEKEILKAHLAQDNVNVISIEEDGINILGTVFADWVNGVMKMILSKKVIDGLEVFNELHFSIENGMIVKTEAVTKKYKTFASCIEE